MVGVLNSAGCIVMGNWVFLKATRAVCLFVLFLFQLSYASIQNVGTLNLGFTGSQMYWIDNDGMFLVSNNTNFGFGLTGTQDVTKFLLVVMHQHSQTIVWAANRDSPIQNSENFEFDDTGNAYLQRGDNTVWSTDTGGKGVSHMELLDSGNLVLRGKDGGIVWQSFSHPSDTLLSNQVFSEGMSLVSNPGSNNLSYSLEMKSGNTILSANFQPPQTYWSMRNDHRITINKDGGTVTSSILNGTSWRFYDAQEVLLWQFIVQGVDENTTWVAVLGDNGVLSFSTLGDGPPAPSLTKIPQDECSSPASCGLYSVCASPPIRCTCPISSCNSLTFPSCENSTNDLELVSAGDGLTYPALGFAQPNSRTTLDGCKSSCLANCSCGALFFQNNTGNCFFFNEIGSMEQSSNGVGYTSFVKVSASGASASSTGAVSHRRLTVIIIVIVIVTVMVISVMLYLGFRYYRSDKKVPESLHESSEEDNFLDNFSGMPVRFSYKDLVTATDNFSVKLGQGGFGSVYKGTLPDGSLIAVKQLEGIGQGKKEFRAEVSIIGSIHHFHLVRLRGFCVEGSHRLLAYEFMENGSLDKWLFKKDKGEFMLDWETRYNIAVDTAKGLAYLHEDCDVKIVHCDIKPENVLLDGHFMAKVSDFGLAKLMTREQSHVFTTLRGTRGYLAPEWITNYAISEKSDVYSFGMVLLELVGGRKNYDPAETSEKLHFPSYAFKMLEEGKLKDLIDAKLKVGDEDERVAITIKVALWCIQDDMCLRPPMTKVVQMLEGLTPVPAPPTASQMGSCLYSSFYKSMSDGTSSRPSDCNSDAYLSAVRLSGPR